MSHCPLPPDMTLSSLHSCHRCQVTALSQGVEVRGCHPSGAFRLSGALYPGCPPCQAMSLPRHAPNGLAQSFGHVHSCPLLSPLMAESRTRAEQGRARLCDTSPFWALPPEKESPEPRSPRCCCPSRAKPEGLQGEQTAYQLTGLEKARPWRAGLACHQAPTSLEGGGDKKPSPSLCGLLPTQGKPSPR